MAARDSPRPVPARPGRCRLVGATLRQQQADFGRREAGVRAKKIRDMTVTMPAADAYVWVQHVGNEIPKFKPTYADPTTHQLSWHKGWGWTNPVDVTATLYPTSDDQCVVRLEASLLALFDPMGILDRALDRFARHLAAHLHAAQHQLPPPVIATTASSWPLTVMLIGGFGLVMGLMIVTAALLLF